MDNNNLTDRIISDEDERESRIHELIKGRRSLNIEMEMAKTTSLGERMAEKVATFAGSWSFLISFAVIVMGWAVINTELILRKPFDPYPYIFLNLVLACISSIQAPIIMMSQNREAKKDRMKADSDYLVNMKSEIILEDLHMKIDSILADQKKLKKQLKDIKISIDEMSRQAAIRSDIDGKADTGEKEPGYYS